VPLKGLLLVVALGALRGPSCGTDAQANGLNGPCTRTTDCEEGLVCPAQGGFCVWPDAGPPDVAGKLDSGALDAADAG
jgi:hypothetical protein